MATAPKFRPVFSEDDLRTIYAALPECKTKVYLRAYLSKIGLGLITAGYVPTGTSAQSHLNNSLGFSQNDYSTLNDSDSVSSSPCLDDCVSLLKQWERDPLTLTTAQLERVHSHRYAENLMSPQEEKDYEQRNGLAI